MAWVTMMGLMMNWAFIVISFNYGRELDDLAILMASQAALHDLPWKKHLSEDNPRRGEVLEAKEKEIKGLLSPQPAPDGSPNGKPCLVEVFPGDPRYSEALKLARTEADETGH